MNRITTRSAFGPYNRRPISAFLTVSVRDQIELNQQSAEYKTSSRRGQENENW